MKVIIFCVNYNSYKELQAYIDSLEHSVCNENLKLTVVVSDNSEKIKKIKNDYSFELINLKTGNNLGYFGGITYGIQNCGKSIEDYDYSIISNVDVKISEDFFSHLLSIKVSDTVGCIAPKIFSVGENRDRNPGVLKRYSAKKLKALRLMYKYPVMYYIYVFLFYGKRRKRIEEKAQETMYAAHGSFMIFTKRFTDFLQHMEYPVFLFGEEIYIAENLRKRGLKTIYETDLVIIDEDHTSTSKMKRKSYFKCNYDAINMILKEFYIR